jgi:hypothetical protein
MSGMPPCVIWSIPTKTLVDISQLLGRLSSFSSRHFHVFRTTLCLRALLPYLLLVIAQSSVSLVFIVVSHQLWISASWGHSTLGLSLLIHLHLSLHIKCALSDMSTCYIWFTSLRDLPSWVLKSTSPHLVICPMFHSSGQDQCFFHNSFSTFFHTIPCPGISHCRICV